MVPWQRQYFVNIKITPEFPFKNISIILKYKNKMNTEVESACLKLNEMSLKSETKNFDEKFDPKVQINTNLNIKPAIQSVTSNSNNFLKETSFSNDFTFDNVVGCLEDMLIDEEFQALQKSILEKYWKEFDATEENKHSYMTIFNEYTNKNENFIAEYIKQRIANFNMEHFVSELERKRSSLEGEVFEVLLTLTDFKAFKEIFLDYRAMKEGRTIDLGDSLCISSLQY